ncbi:MAG: 4-hydroxy-tetrahydrodipicolinate reductase [Bacteroidales bacterium]|nr:4-hydroxy-tetrahydrodipicolinate reductase [Candidatus Colimorpha pelethequi]
MKIALLGYGKMGKAIEALADERGHKVCAVIDNESDWMTKIDDLRRCDVAIDFSMPSCAVENIMKCFNIDVPIVVGTTGWYDQLDAVKEECRQRGQALFVASNFSIGMNIMFALNERLAQLMNGQPDYKVAISETHHIHKLDAPSGTAITLANAISDEIDRYEGWEMSGKEEEDEIPVTSIREGEVPGIHVVTYDSEIDTITLSHSAKSRKGLALGAILAAEYLEDKKGFYTMKELLSL